MTGRELIVYILNNELEDEPIYKDGKLLGFLSVEDAAMKFDVGLATVRAWIASGLLEGIEIGDTIYILTNTEHPVKHKQKGEK